jgi:hypothetical protein
MEQGEEIVFGDEIGSWMIPNETQRAHLEAEIQRQNIPTARKH